MKFLKKFDEIKKSFDKILKTLKQNSKNFLSILFSI